MAIRYVFPWVLTGDGATYLLYAELLGPQSTIRPTELGLLWGTAMFTQHSGEMGGGLRALWGACGQSQSPPIAGAPGRLLRLG